MNRSAIIGAIALATFLKIAIDAKDFVYIAADADTQIITIGPASDDGSKTAITFRDGHWQDVRAAPEAILSAMGAKVVSVGETK